MSVNCAGYYPPFLSDLLVPTPVTTKIYSGKLDLCRAASATERSRAYVTMHHPTSRPASFPHPPFSVEWRTELVECTFDKTCSPEIKKNRLARETSRVTWCLAPNSLLLISNLGFIMCCASPVIIFVKWYVAKS